MPRDTQRNAAKRRANLSVGATVRTVRELQELTQTELAARSGIGQPLLSGIEHGRIALGVERAKKLARALKVHPAVLLFPNWDEEEKRAARAAKPQRGA